MSFTQPIVFNINATYAIFDPKAMESMASQAREAANSAAIMDKRTPPKMVETPADRKRTFSQCENNSAQTTSPASGSASVAESVLTHVSTAPPRSVRRLVPAPTPAPVQTQAQAQAPEQTPEPATRSAPVIVSESNSEMDVDNDNSVSAHDSIVQQSIATSTPNQYLEIIVIDDDDDDDQPIHEYIKKESEEKKQT